MALALSTVFFYFFSHHGIDIHSFSQQTNSSLGNWTDPLVDTETNTLRRPVHGR